MHCNLRWQGLGSGNDTFAHPCHRLRRLVSPNCNYLKSIALLIALLSLRKECKWQGNGQALKCLPTFILKTSPHSAFLAQKMHKLYMAMTFWSCNCSQRSTWSKFYVSTEYSLHSYQLLFWKLYSIVIPWFRRCTSSTWLWLSGAVTVARSPHKVIFCLNWVFSSFLPTFILKNYTPLCFLGS